jgi:hypothetical protein
MDLAGVIAVNVPFVPVLGAKYALVHHEG